MPASKLALYRRKKGLTQEQLAELSGVTTRTIQRIENGAVVPHIQTLKMLAECLDVDTELLMDDAEGNIAGEDSSQKAELAPLFHLLALVGLFLPGLNIALPFILWIIKKNENPAYNRQGKQVLNFHIPMTVLFYISIPVMALFFPFGFPLMIITYFFMAIMSMINLYRSVKLLQVKYPLSYPVFKIQEAV